MEKMNGGNAIPVEEIKKDIGITSTEETEKKDESLEQFLPAAEKEVKKPKKKRGRKSKREKEIEQALEAADKLLKLGFANALKALCSGIASFAQNDIWKIEDDAEAVELATVIVDYLNVRFPDWGKLAPEVQLLVGLSGYFARRVEW